MKLDSVRSFKQELADRYAAGVTELDPPMARFFEATDPQHYDSISLGVALKAGAALSDFVVSIRSSDPAAADRIAALAHGEADVRIIPSIDARSTPQWLQARRDPLECGVQVGLQAKNSVGTLGCIVRDNMGRPYALSNSHVFADGGKAPIGSFVTQSGKSSAEIIGVLDRFIPYSGSTPNLVDCAVVRLAKVRILPRHNLAIGGDIRGVRVVTPDDLGAHVFKVGRTTGISTGKITSVEMDNLPVNMGDSVPRFSDQIEISGGPAADFSAPGDSGSLILDAAGWAVGLLFAGGRDGKGEDFTYANQLSFVLQRLGMVVA